jgi:hypothetical protein
VRRAFVRGDDSQTGHSYEHRRLWIEDRLLEIADVFAIHIAAYAIMSNRYHVVLRINRDMAQMWTIKEVAER